MKVKPLSRVRLFSNPMDSSLLGSSAHGIFQARVLEWGAVAFSIVRWQWLANEGYLWCCKSVDIALRGQADVQSDFLKRDISLLPTESCQVGPCPCPLAREFI